MGFALRAEHAPQRLLGGGLADRAGDRDHLRIETRARRMREIDEAGQHVIDHKQRRVGGEFVALGCFDHRQRRARLQGGVDEIMAVMDVALDREIGLARREACGCRWKCRSPLPATRRSTCARIAAAIAVEVHNGTALMRPSVQARTQPPRDR